VNNPETIFELLPFAEDENNLDDPDTDPVCYFVFGEKYCAWECDVAEFWPFPGKRE
jgi:hypothetical protein